MLQIIREKAQGWIAWIIILLIAITFVLFWGSGSFFQSMNERAQTAAKVNGSPITYQELQSHYEQALKQHHQELSALDPQKIKAQVLDSLIEEKVLSQAAQKLGLFVSPQYLQILLNQTPIFLENGQFSQAAYRRFLNNAHLTDQDFQNILTSQLLQQQLFSGFAQTSFVIEPELKNFVKFLDQKRSIRYTLVKRQPFADKLQVTESMIQAYYDEHTQDFYTSEKIALEYVLLTPDQLKSKFHPSEDQITAFYQEHKSLFTEPEKRLPAHIFIAVEKEGDSEAKEKRQEQAKEKAQMVLNRLKAGESFEALAKTYSDDKETKSRQGKLDWIITGEIGMPAFEKAVFALNKGEVSGLVKTNFGYHIIKLIDIQPEVIHPFSEIKTKVIEVMQDHWAEDELINESDKLANLAYDQPDSLQNIHEIMGLEIHKTGLFDPTQGAKDSRINTPEVMEAAMSDYVKTEGNNSDLIKLGDQGFVVLRVYETQASKLEPLDTVAQEIKTTIIFDKSLQEAKEHAEAILEKTKIAAQSPEQLAQILKQYTWMEKEDLTRREMTLDRSLLEDVYQLPKIQDNLPSLNVVQMENGDYAVVWLTAVKEGEANQMSDKEKKQFQDHLVKQMGDLEYLIYAKACNQRANIQKMAES